MVARVKIGIDVERKYKAIAISSGGLSEECQALGIVRIHKWFPSEAVSGPDRHDRHVVESRNYCIKLLDPRQESAYETILIPESLQASWRTEFWSLRK